MSFWVRRGGSVARSSGARLDGQGWKCFLTTAGNPATRKEDSRERGSAALPDLSLSLALAPDEPRAFYRLLAVEQPARAKLGSGGAQVFGYSEAFAGELAHIGQISPDAFAALFPAPMNYVQPPSIGISSTLILLPLAGRAVLPVGKTTNTIPP